ncbi:MAG: hypothetical protein NXI24_10635 [bacterium]|nr:hypothetical protein [bacterium]
MDQPPNFFQQHDRYYFDLADVYGEIVWNGVLNRDRAVMYSAWFPGEAPQVPAYRTYYKIIAVESVAILDDWPDEEGFRGTGLKLLETQEPPENSPDFAALERTLLERLNIGSRDRLVSRDPFASFELLVSPDRTNSYNLYQENLELSPWSGWAGEAMDIGALKIAPL